MTLAMLGCHEQPAEAPPVEAPLYLTPDAHLVRASMAIRGVRPSAEDLAAARADPAALPDLVDAYLASPELGETAKDLWAERLLLRADTRDPWPAIEAMAWTTDGAIFHAMNEAPLRLIEAVVLEDRPFSEVLTDPRVHADEVLVSVYGLEGWDPDGPPVQRLAWPDGRPSAGVLADTALWQRHESNGSNFHRGRANRIADVFLCDDIGDRDIDLSDSVDLSDPAVVSDAVASVPSCAACHDVLDPLAGHLWGFKGNMRRSGIFLAYAQHDCAPPYQDWCYPVRFRADDEVGGWADNGLPEPDFWGEPVGDLADLGAAIGADPRFDRCMAKQWASGLLQVDRDAIDEGLVDAWSGAFAANDQSARALVRAIVLSDVFRTVEGAEEGDAAAGVLVVGPEQLSRLIFDLTGFRWLAEPSCEAGSCWDEVDLMTSSLHGFRAMAGGIDGYQVTRPAHGATPTRHLTMARLANEAAGYVVARDLAQPDRAQRKLLTELDAGDVDEASVRAQLRLLHDRILAEPLSAGDAELDASLALFEAALASHQGDDVAAWTVVIAGFLQDVRVLFY